MLEVRGIDPYIATGHIPHYLSLPDLGLPEVKANELESQHTDLPCEQLNAASLVTTTETEEAQEQNMEAITTGNASIEASDVEQAEELSSSDIQELEEAQEQKVEAIITDNTLNEASDIEQAEELSSTEIKEAKTKDQSSEEQSNDNEPSAKVKMASKLKTEAGKAVYRLRKCTVEPVIGIIKETIGFRQFSLRGLEATAGEWSLICLAFNLKRLHVLTEGELCFSL